MSDDQVVIEVDATTTPDEPQIAYYEYRMRPLWICKTLAICIFLTALAVGNPSETIRLFREESDTPIALALFIVGFCVGCIYIVTVWIWVPIGPTEWSLCGIRLKPASALVLWTLWGLGVAGLLAGVLVSESEPSVRTPCLQTFGWGLMFIVGLCIVTAIMAVLTLAMFLCICVVWEFWIHHIYNRCATKISEKMLRPVYVGAGST